MMDKWSILRGDNYNYTIFPPTPSRTSVAACAKKRNYGCFKYFRKNLPPLLRSLSLNNSGGSGYERSGSSSSSSSIGYQKMPTGTCCSKLLLNKNKKGQQNKIILYAEESWAQSAASTYWLITPSYWRRNGCNIEEISGYRKNKGKGEIIFCNGGSVVIAGSFNKSQHDIPDFKLSLTTNVGQTEFNMGYSMTGTLERGWSAMNKFETTHYAVVKKHWPESSFSAKAGFKLL